MQQQDRRAAFGLVTDFHDANLQATTREQIARQTVESASDSSTVVTGFPVVITRGASNDRSQSDSRPGGQAAWHDVSSSELSWLGGALPV